MEYGVRPSEVTGLLKRWSAGDSSARDQLIPLVYERLRELAHQRLRGAPAEVMRNLLVDRARARLAAKRGRSQAALELDETLWVSDENLETVADLHEALARLEALSPRQSQLLQHRYFGGLSLEESAWTLGISLPTAKRELRSARAWLAIELKGKPLR